MTFFCYYFVTLLGGFKNNMYLCSGNKFILIMAKKKKVIKAKEPIRMRIKELKGGNRSIYLDTYLNGKHHYEFLKMYLVPEVDETAKTLNANTLQAANAIKAQRLLELTQERGGIHKSGHRENMPLFDWIEEFKQRCIKRGNRTTSYIDSTKTLLTKFGCEKLLMKDIDKDFCLRFLNFIKVEFKGQRGKPLKAVTQANYVKYMNCILNDAVKAEVISENPFIKIKGLESIRVPESPREFLTIDEIKKLIETPCSWDEVKKAYLFSCYCGLRISDIENLKWGDIIRDGEQYRIQIVMQKTREPLYLPLSKQALRWIPERGEASDEDNVFNSLPVRNWGNLIIKKWAKDAGITKHLSYHTARHTFATMMLTLGADLYTTSKLLGHTKVATTEIYAKIVNSKKDEAVNLVDKVFD